MHQSGRYGVKDIEEGRKKANRSDIHYSIDDDDEDNEDDEGKSLNNDLLDGNSAKKPIFRGSSTNGGLKKAADGLRASENSLLNAEDDLWLVKGMEEDGSFREGRYAE